MAPKKQTIQKNEVEIIENQPALIGNISTDNLDLFQINPYNPRNFTDYEVIYRDDMVSVLDQDRDIPKRWFEIANISGDKKTAENLTALIDSIVSFDADSDSFTFKVLNPLRVTPFNAHHTDSYTILSGNTRFWMLKNILGYCRENGYGIEVNVPYIIDNGYIDERDLLTTALVDNTGVPLRSDAHWVILENGYRYISTKYPELSVSEAIQWLRDNLCYGTYQSPTGNKRIPVSTVTKWKICVENPKFVETFSSFCSQYFLQRLEVFFTSQGLQTGIEDLPKLSALVSSALSAISKKSILSEGTFKKVQDAIKIAISPKPIGNDTTIVDESEEFGNDESDDSGNDDDKLSEWLDRELGSFKMIHSPKVKRLLELNSEDFTDKNRANKLLTNLSKLLTELNSLVITSDEELIG